MVSLVIFVHTHSFQVWNMKRSVLEIFLNLNGILCITSDDFDDVEVIILDNINRTGDYYKPRLVCVMQ